MLAMQRYLKYTKSINTPYINQLSIQKTMFMNRSMQYLVGTVFKHILTCPSMTVPAKIYIILLFVRKLEFQFSLPASYMIYTHLVYMDGITIKHQC